MSTSFVFKVTEAGAVTEAAGGEATTAAAAAGNYLETHLRFSG